MLAISTEAAVISASLSQIQALILSKDKPEQLLRSRPELAATLDTSLTGCMVLFSCIDEELRTISRHAKGRDNFTKWGKIKAVWKQDRFQELLEGLRGQQMAVNTLFQLLQMYITLSSHQFTCTQLTVLGTHCERSRNFSSEMLHSLIRRWSEPSLCGKLTPQYRSRTPSTALMTA